MANGNVAHSANAKINDLFTGGGMSSMLTTVWLILGALSFAAVMEHAGFLQRLLRPLVRRATGARGSEPAGGAPAITRSGAASADASPIPRT